MQTVAGNRQLRGAFVLAALAGTQAFGQSATEEIVVTGERVERSLMQTAASVTVIDARQLAEQAGPHRLEQVLEFVPNLQLGAHEQAPTVRGQESTGVLIGANAFLGGTRPRATLQVDGRALSLNEFLYGLNSTWDVNRIEVFRGPQTTTQGRNAIAGAIFIETNDPTFEFEGAGQAMFGDYGARQASVALSGPLAGEQLAGRIAIDWREHESWMNYTAPDVFVGADRSNDDHALARAKLLFTPDAVPDLQLKFTYSHLDANNPQGETADLPYKDRTKAVQNGAHWDTSVDAFVLNADYEFTDTVSGSLRGTYADTSSERFANPGFGEAFVDANEDAIEGLLHFTPGSGRTSGLIGFSWFQTDQTEFIDLSAFLGLGDFTDNQRSIGLFGEATFAATPRLSVTLGGRWQEDSQDRSGTLGPVGLEYDESFDEFLPKAELAWSLRDNVTIGATARRGFNPGGTTVSFVTGDIDTFDAETLWSYEFFARASLADGNLILSGNVFLTEFDNAQRPQVTAVTLPDNTVNFFTEFANAPEAESYGFEFESTWSISPVVQLRGALGYLHTKVTETLEPSDPILGREFMRAPEVTAVLGLRIQPMEPLTIDVSARYNSDYFSDDANTEAFRIDGVTIVDLRTSYDFERVSVFAFMRNATDELYQTWQFVPGNSPLGDPREYGFGLQGRF